MKAPLPLIRRGIDSGDWSLVCEGYGLMTGEKVAPPSVTGDSISLLKSLYNQVAGFLDAGVGGVETKVFPPKAEVPKKKPGGPKKQQVTKSQPKRVKPVPSRDEDIEQGSDTEDEDDAEDGDDAEDDPPPKLKKSNNPKNAFVDDVKLAASDIAMSKKLSRSRTPEPRRPEVKKVSVKCCKCDRRDKVSPSLAGGVIEGKERMAYVCNDCIGPGSS